MTARRARLAAALLLAALAALSRPAQAAPTTTRPNVRTITAFVRIDRASWRATLGDARRFLEAARAAYAAEGWFVESVRVTTQPFPDYVAGLSQAEALALLSALDAAAVEGGFGLDVGPALRGDGGDPAMARLLERFLASARTTNGSVHVVADRPGRDPEVQWGAVREAVRIIRYLSDHSPEGQAGFNFAATALVEPHAPFYPASWHDGPGRRFAIGLESAGVVAEVFAATGYDPPAAEARLAYELGAHAAAVEAIAQRAAGGGWHYLGLDPTPAPFDGFASIGGALEAFTGVPLGGSGTLTAARAVTAAVRALPVRRVGLQGLMLPVLEDSVIARRWGEGRLSLDALLAYSAVCGTGLDTVPLPGDVTDAQLTRIVGDVATLAARWGKPLTARLLVVPGRRAGEATAFDSPFLTNTVLQPLP